MHALAWWSESAFLHHPRTHNLIQSAAAIDPRAAPRRESAERWYDKRDTYKFYSPHEINLSMLISFSLNTSATCALDNVGAGNCTAVLITNAFAYENSLLHESSGAEQSASRLEPIPLTPYRGRIHSTRCKELKVGQIVSHWTFHINLTGKSKNSLGGSFRDQWT